MLYLSLFLIASGIFFIICTLLIRTKKEPGISRSMIQSGAAGASSNNVKPQGIDDGSGEKVKGKSIENDLNYPDAGIDISSADDAGTGVKEEIAKDDLFENSEKDAASIIVDNDEKMSNTYPVALYEDSSNLIEYDNKDSIIDTTFNGYKKIKRIGAGSIDILEDRIDFRTGKKLFRFDFRQIADIKSGDNFIVLSLKGSSALRLFLFKKNAFLSGSVKQVYNNYLTNVL